MDIFADARGVQKIMAMKKANLANPILPLHSIAQDVVGIGRFQMKMRELSHSL
jgi:hypothetical protein